MKVRYLRAFVLLHVLSAMCNSALGGIGSQAAAPGAHALDRETATRLLKTHVDFLNEQEDRGWKTLDIMGIVNGFARDEALKVCRATSASSAFIAPPEGGFVHGQYYLNSNRIVANLENLVSVAYDLLLHHPLELKNQAQVSQIFQQMHSLNPAQVTFVFQAAKKLTEASASVEKIEKAFRNTFPLATLNPESAIYYTLLAAHVGDPFIIETRKIKVQQLEQISREMFSTSALPSKESLPFLRIMEQLKHLPFFDAVVVVQAAKKTYETNTLAERAKEQLFGYGIRQRIDPSSIRRVYTSTITPPNSAKYNSYVVEFVEDYAKAYI
ncbi:unnamed protein product [Hyaloperonospora brassicae]|uniref:Uncharacterized protein n=1 Tax=Hyaloperonospora brassicae TaxID=162125 RepID=A0AAV0V353_HYABA|nr:unnamed protein product [Hyaloperonospora brassicae]